MQPERVKVYCPLCRNEVYPTGWLEPRFNCDECNIDWKLEVIENCIRTKDGEQNGN